ncbi:MAG TPA: serine hydrolase domain-containing protein [Solirubrobacter sp.]|nr:serine hydrolase domain-containing protein [Solirubrobacter sp.]
MLTAEIDPAQAGFDATRLTRIDRYYQRYVDEGQLPGYLVVVARDGRIVHVAKGGYRDVGARAALETDTQFRIYSMTKPITSVAAMLLWEEGAFELKDPIATFLPEFADARVWAGGSALYPQTVPAREPVRMWHLLTHTSGLTYGFHHVHPLDAVYRDHGYEFGAPRGTTLEAAVRTWASLPLLFEPGTEFNYSVSTDVLGRVLEVIDGRPLDQLLHERIFAPLGMVDTRFGNADPDRLAALYDLGLKRNDRMGDVVRTMPAFLSGGGGLISTAADYHRFTTALLDDALLAPRTFALMGRNHLPGELRAVARPTIADIAHDGLGFGLGFRVVLDPARTKLAGPAGELAWSGLAGTTFWLDPAARIAVSFYTQLLRSSAYPLRTRLRQLVYQALTRT